MTSLLDRRPIVVALAGPNGAGKTTFYHTHLRAAGLRLVNADVVARELDMDAYSAARVTQSIREAMIQQGESFVLETVFSDPVGDKLSFLKDAIAKGYTVVLCFIGIASTEISEERVAMRVSQGGHDVPSEKLQSRYPRTMGNLRLSIAELPYVQIFDNSDLSFPYRLIAVYEEGRATQLHPPLPKWLPV